MSVHHLFQKFQVGVRDFFYHWVMSINYIIGELCESLLITLQSKILKSAGTYMPQGDPCKDRARQNFFPIYRLPGGDSAQRARCRYSKRMHRLANNIFTKHWAECSTPISLPGEWGKACSFELNITAKTRIINDFSKENGTPVAQLRNELAKLMTGIDHSERFSARQDLIAGENLCQCLRLNHLKVDT